MNVSFDLSLIFILFVSLIVYVIHNFVHMLQINWYHDLIHVHTLIFLLNITVIYALNLITQNYILREMLYFMIRSSLSPLYFYQFTIYFLNQLGYTNQCYWSCSPFIDTKILSKFKWTSTSIKCIQSCTCYRSPG